MSISLIVCISNALSNNNFLKYFLFDSKCNSWILVTNMNIISSSSQGNPGSCPPADDNEKCGNDCMTDVDCKRNEKCCRTSCGFICKGAVHYRKGSRSFKGKSNYGNWLRMYWKYKRGIHFLVFILKTFYKLNFIKWTCRK